MTAKRIATRIIYPWKFRVKRRVDRLDAATILYSKCRNGLVKTCGVTVFVYSDRLTLVPINSKGDEANGRLELPRQLAVIRRLREVLQSLETDLEATALIEGTLEEESKLSAGSD